MKEFSKDNNSTWLKKEKVPAQEWITISLDGIPQEVIDEIYDDYADVNYDHYLKPTAKKKGEIKTFLADYFEKGEKGDFSYVDPDDLKEKSAMGQLLVRFNIVGKVKNGIKGEKKFDLLSVYSYNTIKTNK